MYNFSSFSFQDQVYDVSRNVSWSLVQGAIICKQTLFSEWMTIISILVCVCSDDFVFEPGIICLYMQKPCCPHTTVLDMMDVADVDVLNTLIDQCSVESILLIEQRSEANHVIEHQRIHGVISVSSFLCARWPCHRVCGDLILYCGIIFLHEIQIFKLIRDSLPLSQAYTLDGDQILPNRHYSNKRGKLGIIRASVDDAIRC